MESLFRGTQKWRDRRLMKRYRTILKDGEQALLKAGIENAVGEAWYLFEDAFSMDRMTYYMDQEKVCQDTKGIDMYQTYLKKRIEQRVPLQYLLGTQDFMGLTFRVSEAVLIPRQDTETLIEEILKEAQGVESVLDMCTGSGCIAISLAYYMQLQKCVAADISKEALKIAKENGKSLAPMVEFIHSDLFDEIEGRYDLIVSNPPYIASKECRELMPEVREHEPMLALDGQEDGLHFYRRIVGEAPHYLNPGGYLFFEIGYDQGESVPALMEAAGFSDVRVRKDLAGLDRIVYGRYKSR